MKLTNHAAQAAKLAITIAVAGSLFACQPKDEAASEYANTEAEPTKVNYPTTAKGDVVDTYFGEQVADPYRWLEDDRSPETEAWVKAQNQTTQAYLENIPYRDKIATVVRDLLNYERVSAPFIEGD